MTLLRRNLARTALVAAIALTGSAAISTTAAQAAEVPVRPAVSDNVDYFAATYPGLGTGSVYETVTYERFEYLLKKDTGTYAFLIGGPTSANTRATIGYINQVAKSYGVKKIYNFDPKLDGATDALDVRKSTNTVVSELYTRLLTNYLSKDTTTVFTGADTDPSLFIYDASHKVEGAEDRIVSALDSVESAASLSTTAAVTSYKAKVASVFDAVSTGSPKVAQLDVNTQFQFLSEQINSRHVATYADESLYGGPILTEDDSDFRLQSITYPELINLLKTPGDHAILFGGTWCHNTRAVVKYINDQARANGVGTVYVFDLRLDGLSSNDLHIRATSSQYANLYGDLVATYFPNLVTQYIETADKPASQRVEYYPGGDTTQTKKAVKKLQVPYVIEYNKDAKSSTGAAAPIVNQWIHKNADGTYTEYMTEWWNTLHRPGYTSDPAALTENYAFADEAVAALKPVFAGVAAHRAKTTTTLALSAKGYEYGKSAVATVSVAGQNISSGSVTIRDGAKTITTVASVAVGGKATYTLPASLAVGKHSLTAVFTPKAGATVTGSSSAPAVLTVSAIATTTKLKVVKAPTKKAKGKFTITVKASGVPVKSVTGSYVIKVGKKTVAKGKIKNGTSTVKIPKTKAGKKKFTVTFKGTTTLKSSKVAKTIKVKKS